MDRLITQLCLALYASDRKVERLPKVRTYQPREIVAIVAPPPHLASQITRSTQLVEGL